LRNCCSRRRLKHIFSFIELSDDDGNDDNDAAAYAAAALDHHALETDDAGVSVWPKTHIGQLTFYLKSCDLQWQFTVEYV
jgi:hypothetical protein